MRQLLRTTLKLVTIVALFPLAQERGFADPPSTTQTAADLADVEDAPVKTEEMEISTSERFRAYLMVLKSYETSVSSRAWKWDQEVTFVYPRESERRTARFFGNEFVVAPDGRWSIAGWRAVRSETGRRNFLEERFYFDGECVFASNVKARSGIVRGHDSDLNEGLLSPLMLVGGAGSEHVTNPWMIRLSQILERLSELSVDESRFPLVRLGGYHLARDKWVRLEVTLNVDQGGMPVHIVEKFDFYDVISQELETVEALEVDGVWMPISGKRVLNSLEQPSSMADMSQEQQQEGTNEVMARARDAGLSVSGADLAASIRTLEKHADRVKMRKIVDDVYRDIFGETLVFYGAPLGDFYARLQVTELQTVPLEELEEAFAKPFDEGFEVFDQRTGKSYQVSEGELIPLDGE